MFGKYFKKFQLLGWKWGICIVWNKQRSQVCVRRWNKCSELSVRKVYSIFLFLSQFKVFYNAVTNFLCISGFCAEENPCQFIFIFILHRRWGKSAIVDPVHSNRTIKGDWSRKNPGKERKKIRMNENKRYILIVRWLGVLHTTTAVYENGHRQWKSSSIQYCRSLPWPETVVRKLCFHIKKQ